MKHKNQQGFCKEQENADVSKITYTLQYLNVQEAGTVLAHMQT